MKVIHPKGYDPSSENLGWIDGIFLVGALGFVAYQWYKGNGGGSTCEDEDDF